MLALHTDALAVCAHDAPEPEGHVRPTNLELPLGIPRLPAVAAAVRELAADGGVMERGAIFTRRPVVDAILDLCGYTSDRPLHEMRLLEPAFGGGDFLLAVVDRLVASFRSDRSHGRDRASSCWSSLASAIRAVELHTDTFTRTRAIIFSRLREIGVPEGDAALLLDAWLVNDDFLSVDLGGRFDFVVGNPPYVRQERIASALLADYRRRFATFYDRADLYILFYERGLDLLSQRGSLGYVCSNRWIKNRYGGPLRDKVARGFRLKFFVDLERTDAFLSDVVAYPAITVIEAGTEGPTYASLSHQGCASGLGDVVQRLRSAASTEGGHHRTVVVLDGVASGTDPWLLDQPDVLVTLRSLESRFPMLEHAGTKVGIGVATGADKVFVGPYDELPVEDDRKLPLVMAADCKGGGVEWGGMGIVNPYLDSGKLAPLDEFPQFASYLRSHAALLQRRHTAKKQPLKWYKTIDRIYPALRTQPKLLIPDIKGQATVSLDPGHYYPHHNLYVVTSNEWDLRALQAVLRSSVALLFVASYGVRMAGGFLRFQAQYLRRIRVPRWSHVGERERAALVRVATSADQDEVDSVVFPLYGLTGDAAAAVRSFAEASRAKKKPRV